MKNKIYKLFSEGFKRGQYIRLKEHDTLHIYVGKDDNGRFSFEYRGHYTPSRLLGSEVISVAQTKTGNLLSLCFSLENTDLLEYFCTFCDDLINSILETTDENTAYKVLCQRYLSWKKLFRPNQGRLNENEIMGLIGELLFLRDKMFPSHGFDVSLDSWTGPEYTHKDFSLDDEWHEVKTISVGKSTVKISSLEQLDCDVKGTLSIYELEKMSSTFNGIRLNDLVSQIIGLLNSHQRELFMSKLSQFGYDFSPEYNNYVYSLSSYNQYQVADDFPRLKRDDIPVSIQRVQYDIIIAEIDKFKIEL